MRFKIGFTAHGAEEKKEQTAPEAAPTKRAEKVRPSVVQVRFPDRHGLTCAYYNDAFDLHVGDLVYVDGKLTGLRGRVVDVSYTFKIKLSEYKRVIGRAETDVRGTVHMAGSHLVAFERAVLPFEKVRTWFCAPEDPEEPYVSGSGDDAFLLEDLTKLKIQADIFERGGQYYTDNEVVYLTVDGTRGRALVEGGEMYTVEFTYDCGEVRDLVCGCFSSGICKHAVGAMLQLRETVKYIAENYAEQYSESGYFAAVNKEVFYLFTVGRQETGTLTLG